MTFYDKNSIFTKTNQHGYKIIKQHFMSCSPLCLIQRSEVLQSTDHGFESQREYFIFPLEMNTHEWLVILYECENCFFFLNYFFHLSLLFSSILFFLVYYLFGKIIRNCVISNLHHLIIENEGASFSVSCRIVKEYCYSLTYTWSRERIIFRVI